MDLTTSLDISAAGMTAQSTRLRVIAQNMANIDSTGSTPGSDPYQRRVVNFTDTMNQALGVKLVEVENITKDNSAFPTKYDPSNPAANSQGYVKMPNVNNFVEMMDMQQAERSYDANLSVMQASRNMLTRTLALLQ
ncbi:MAG TPA: flagellar basal body rod protein FlgC [Acetobacteraceae bacterium]|nr:flagellar basal body rod protein FlgC [Acetobacteraceae bacterium]